MKPQRRTNRDDECVSANPRPSIDQGQVLDSLGRELMGVCIAGLRRYGISSRRIAELTRESLASAGEIPTANEMFADVDRLGDLANEWTENPDYVDSSGRPRILPIRGRGRTFATLAHEHFPNRSIDTIIEMGCRTRVLERVSRDKVAQFGGCVIFAGNPMLMLAHAIHSVRWFLTTTLANAAQHGSALALPDRRACAKVPEQHLVEFMSVMREPLINLVEMGNRWLTARAGHHTGSKKAVTVGIHAYLFKDLEPNKQEKHKSAGRASKS